MNDHLLCVEEDAVTKLTIRVVPGGGVEVSYVLPDGTQKTLDLFPTVQDASPSIQDLLDSLGKGLAIRMEEGSVSVPETPARRVGDLFTRPVRSTLPFEVPALENEG